MYDIAITPLEKITSREKLSQRWYDDDGNATGSIEELIKYIAPLKELGPALGYHVTKCLLIVKSDFLIKAKDVFKNETVDIVDGH